MHIPIYNHLYHLYLINGHKCRLCQFPRGYLKTTLDPWNTSRWRLLGQAASKVLSRDSRPSGPSADRFGRILGRNHWWLISHGKGPSGKWT